jgi:hypothetical protein
MTENRGHRQLMPSDDTVDTLLKTTGAVFWAVFWAVCVALKREPLQRSSLINLKGKGFYLRVSLFADQGGTHEPTGPPARDPLAEL